MPTDDAQQPKKVTKRVVKKAAPSAAKKSVKKAPAKTPSRPTIAYGRPGSNADAAAQVATAPRRPSRKRPAPEPVEQAPVEPVVAPVVETVEAPEPVVEPEPVAARTVVADPEPVAPPEPTGPSAGQRLGAALGAGASATGRGVARGARAVLAWRLPELSTRRAAPLVGLVVGLVTVLLGAGASMAFGALRGTSTGGGRWGTLTVVVVAVVACFVGEYLLSAFGVPQPRLLAVLSVLVSIVLMLAFFLDPLQSGWAWLVLPALGLVTFALCERLLKLAADTSYTA